MVGVVAGKSLSLDLEPQQQTVATQQEQQQSIDLSIMGFNRESDIFNTFEEVRSMLLAVRQLAEDIKSINLPSGSLGLTGDISFAINMILPDNVSYPEMLSAVQDIIHAIAVYQTYDFSAESGAANSAVNAAASRQNYNHIAVLSLDQQMQLAVSLVLSKAIAKDKGRSWGSLEELLAILNDPEIEAELQLIIQQASEVKAPDYELMVEAIKLKLAQDKMRASLNSNVGLSAAMDANQQDEPQVEAPMMMGNTFNRKGQRPEEEES